MRIRGIVLTVVVLVAVVFAVTNWDTMTTRLPVHLLFSTVEWPLGLVLLSVFVILLAFFFLASLWDRSQQLRQVSGLERQIEHLQGKLERKRLEELEGLEQAIRERTTQLESTVEAASEMLEQRLAKKLADHEMRTKDRLDAVTDRVVVVRDELAADVAEAEDLLRRLIEGRALPTANRSLTLESSDAKQREAPPPDET